MAKTLRTLTRAGWTTKPAPDLPENRLTAAEVDATLLAIYDDAYPVFRATQFGGVPGAGTTQHAAIQSAIDAAEAAGGGRVVVDPGLWNISTTLVIGSNVTLELLPGSTIRRMSGAIIPCITNRNPTTGNSNITLIGPGLLDGNRGAGTTGFWNTADFNNVHNCLFFNLHLRGGSRPTPAVLNAEKTGDGLGLRRGSSNNRVIGGKYYDCDYDGIKLRQAFRNSIIGVTFENCHRAGVQITFDRDPVTEAVTEASKWNVVTGCTVTHPTGIVPVGGGSSVNSGFAIHSGAYNVITGNTVYGCAYLCDLLEGANYNTISNNIAFARPNADGRTDRAAINLLDWASTANVGNKFVDNEIHAMSGASSRFVYVRRSQNTVFKGNRFFLSGGTGNWSVELDNNTNGTEVDDTYPTGTTFTWGTGSGNTRFLRSGGTLSFRKADGTTVDLLAAGSGPVIYDTDAEAIINAIEATDAGALDSTVTDAINAFVVSGKTDGWWSLLPNIYGFVGGTANAHAINWKAPAGTAITWTGTLTHSANGVEGGGGHGNSGVTAAAALSRDNHCIGYYCNSPGTNATVEGIMGCGGSSTAGSVHHQQGSDNNILARLSSATAKAANQAIIGTGVTTTQAHVLAQRTGASASNIYRNNVAVGTATAVSSDAAPVAENMLILSRGSAGPTFSGRLALAYWGQSLDSTKRAAMHSAVVALQTALGRAV